MRKENKEEGRRKKERKQEGRKREEGGRRKKNKEEGRGKREDILTRRALKITDNHITIHNIALLSYCTVVMARLRHFNYFFHHHTRRWSCWLSFLCCVNVTVSMIIPPSKLIIELQ